VVDPIEISCGDGWPSQMVAGGVRGGKPWYCLKANSVVRLLNGLPSTRRKPEGAEWEKVKEDRGSLSCNDSAGLDISGVTSILSKYAGARTGWKPLRTLQTEICELSISWHATNSGADKRWCY